MAERKEALAEKTPAKRKVARDEALAWLRGMMLIRRFEEQAEAAYGQGKIGGFLHLYIGEEAIAVGAMAGLKADDEVITHYRDHGYSIARGVEPKRVMAEVYGKVTGVSQGKGGSMHLADLSRHIWGGYAIVGGHIPLAVGLALAIQYQGQKRAVCCILGEGATNIGTFHTSMNMAAVWNLPLLTLVENNRYGMGTDVARASAVTNIYEKGCCYGMSSLQVDGNNVLEVRDAVQELARKARNGEGPQLLEAITYRLRGHSMGDPQRYRARGEVAEWRQRDPIVVWQHTLLEQKLATQKDFDRLQKSVDAEVDEATQFAEESPVPEEKVMYADVLVQE
jgi:pyruvate dehydrogenase E1 component alpha subunit